MGYVRLKVVNVETQEVVAVLSGRNQSHAAERAYDAGWCGVEYEWVYD